jgi:hypothetical protein
MTSALIAMIERKLSTWHQKVIPDDPLLDEVYRAFHRSNELREQFEELESEFEESKVGPKDLKRRSSQSIHALDDAVHVVLDETQLEHVRENKKTESQGR